jgi:hypothetical protein
MNDVTSAPGAECPHCGEPFAIEFMASLPEQTCLTFVIQVAEGQLIQAKTLAGVVDAFDGMQRAIGKEAGYKTTTLIKALETEDNELRITFMICNAASGMEAPSGGETEGLDPQDDSPTAAPSGGDAQTEGE